MLWLHLSTNREGFTKQFAKRDTKCYIYYINLLCILVGIYYTPYKV